jgi:hypothetical protein
LNLIQGGRSEATEFHISEKQNAENNGPAKTEQNGFE